MLRALDPSYTSGLVIVARAGMDQISDGEGFT
jgi:hypothetical protein